MSLETLRRFQMLCKARGQPTLLASVLRSAEGPQWRVRFPVAWPCLAAPMTCAHAVDVWKVSATAFMDGWHVSLCSKAYRQRAIKTCCTGPGPCLSTLRL